MKPLNKQLWSRALDRAVPETYTTLNGEQLGRVIDAYTELVVRECTDLLETSLSYNPQQKMIKKHFGVE